MSDPVRDLLDGLAGVTAAERRADGWWAEAAGLDVTALAEAMRDAGARLATVTALPRPDGETTVIYHFLIGREPVNVRTITRGGALASVTPTLPAANWIEREIGDLYAVDFPGHPDPARLVRPAELPRGFFRHEGAAAPDAVEG